MPHCVQKGGSVTLDERKKIFEEIKEEILSCRACELWRYRKNPVPGEGNLFSKLMFVGEAPGEQEDLQGRPFVGQAGKLLNSLIETLGLSRKDVFITNVIKCRPPGNRDPLPDEVSACNSFLVGQIGLICPKIICTLGRHALHTLVNPSLGIFQVHGSRLIKDGIVFFPTFHPAAALYQQSILQLLVEDFRTLKNLLEEI
jgi:DNA polymerase